MAGDPHRHRRAVLQAASCVGCTVQDRRAILRLVAPFRHLPSLWALQVFEAAGRHRSLKAAAAELCVTPSAVSRQVQALERELEVALFRRLPRGLTLTDDGARYLDEVTRAMQQLDAASGRLRLARRPLRLSVLPSFASTWLVPRIVAFETAHPDVDVRMEATTAFADFERDDVDLAIRFGLGPWPDLHSEPLLELEVYPVCRPEALAGAPPLATPADLARHTWLTSSHVPEGWPIWLRGIGHEGLTPLRTVPYDNAQLMLDAACAGQGVALAPALLAEPLLADGRLVRPFDLTVTSPFTYHLVCRPRALGETRVKAFRDWIVAEMAVWAARQRPPTRARSATVAAK